MGRRGASILLLAGIIILVIGIFMTMSMRKPDVPASNNEWLQSHGALDSGFVAGERSDSVATHASSEDSNSSKKQSHKKPRQKQKKPSSPDSPQSPGSPGWDQSIK